MEANNDNAAAWKDWQSLRDYFYDLSNLPKILEAAAEIRFKDYAYCSYSPDALYRKIADRIADEKWDTTRSYGEITKAVAVGLVKGNITVDKIEKIACGGEIVRLAADFGIHIRRNTKEKMSCKPDTLTFVRFLSLFPHVASQLCLVLPSESTRKIPCGGVYSSACILPVGMKHSGFAALIPRGPEYMAVRGYLSVAFTAFMVEFSDAVMNPSTSNRAPQVKFEEQFRLTRNAIEDGIMSDEERIVSLKVAMINSRVALERILTVVDNVRKVHGMPVEDPRSYVDETVVEGDVWKFGCSREIEGATGAKAAKAIKNMRKKYPDYGQEVMVDHTNCSSLFSSTDDNASANEDLPSSEFVVAPGLIGFQIE